MIRLYLLHQYLNHQPLPIIDKDFILSCIRIGGHTDHRGRPSKKTDLEHTLRDFYEREYQPCINQTTYDLKYKSFIVPYLAVQIQTAFENNITLHFLKRVRKVLNIFKPDSLTDKKLIKRVKNLILLDRHDLIPEEYREWSQQFKEQFLPPTYQKCYGYDVQVNPAKYLPYLIRMNQAIEQRNNAVQNSNLSDEEKSAQIQRLFQPIPLRTSKIPCYITIDANSIVSLFYHQNKGQTGQHIKDHRDEVWGSVFQTNRKVLKMKGYHFCSLQTDGVGVSVCFQKDGLSYKEKHSRLKEPPSLLLEDLTETELLMLQNKKLIGADPGKQSSIYLMDQSQKRLRYTPRQRRAETGTLVCRRVMETMKDCDGVKQAETVLSYYNSKTVDYDAFKEYIRQETLFNQRTDQFYQQDLWRKMKWRMWINRRRSEDQFLNRIEATFGDPEEILICYGNWSETQQMKHLMPSQGIGLRRLISKRFKVVMVDEYHTSKLCNQCHQPLESYQDLYRVRYCPTCQNNRSASTCCFFNRDANACMNMLFLAGEWLNNRRRPVEYRREMFLTTTTVREIVVVENLGTL